MQKERISIFIDFHNLVGAWNIHFKKTKGQVPAEAWTNLNQSLLKLYAHAARVELNQLIHKISLVCYSADQNPARDKGNFLFARRMSKISHTQGMIFHQQPRKEKTQNESGVDSFLVSHMLLGAKRHLFDTAILVSHDNDYAPAVEIIRSKYNSKVIQAAYYNELSEFAILRATCYGQLDLGTLDENFMLN
ncbi:MAG: NYN domain-containing protein [Saprospiraceae bacterium]|nr:NYN domain-containing protein [Candidatus Vicinibacter affinis]